MANLTRLRTSAGPLAAGGVALAVAASYPAFATAPSGPAVPPILWFRAADIPPTALNTNQPDPGNRFASWPNRGSAGSAFDLHVRPGDGNQLYRYPTAGPGGVVTTLQVDGLDRLYSTPTVPITGMAPRSFAHLGKFSFEGFQSFWSWGEYAPDPECAYFGLSYNGEGLVANHYFRRITILPAAVCQQHDGQELLILVSESVVNGQLHVRYRVSLADGTVLASGVNNSVPAAEINTHATPFCLGYGFMYGRGYAESQTDLQVFDYAAADEDFTAIRAELNHYTSQNF